MCVLCCVLDGVMCGVWQEESELVVSESPMHTSPTPPDSSSSTHELMQDDDDEVQAFFQDEGASPSATPSICLFHGCMT